MGGARWGLWSGMEKRRKGTAEEEWRSEMLIVGSSRSRCGKTRRSMAVVLGGEETKELGLWKDWKWLAIWWLVDWHGGGEERCGPIYSRRRSVAGSMAVRGAEKYLPLSSMAMGQLRRLWCAVRGQLQRLSGMRQLETAMIIGRGLGRA
uniref:Uncharacterized protein n=1 Tax=Arundo donax TaxID=35708 RepID=A0A0A9EB79_ARUDO